MGVSGNSELSVPQYRESRAIIISLFLPPAVTGRVSCGRLFVFLIHVILVGSKFDTMVSAASQNTNQSSKSAQSIRNF